MFRVRIYSDDKVILESYFLSDLMVKNWHFSYSNCYDIRSFEKLFGVSLEHYNIVTSARLEKA